MLADNDFAESTKPVKGVDLDPPFDPSTLMTNGKLARILAPDVPLFPCYEAGVKMKAPYEGVPWKSARAGQIGRVENWWAAHPDAMPGLHLGEAGLLVVDADPPDGIAAWEALCEQHGGMPECPMVDTPSGGRHYYFRQRPGHKLGNGRGALPPKERLCCDIRGDGGYVIAPDATREDGIYLPLDMDARAIIQSAADMPDWLFDLLTAKGADTADTIGMGPASEPMPEQGLQPSQVANGPTPMPAVGIPTSEQNQSVTDGGVTSANRMQPSRPLDMSHPRLRAWVESAFEYEVQKLATSAKGGRNEQLNRSAFAIYQLVAAGWIQDRAAHTALSQAAEACGLTKDDGRKSVMDTIASAKRGGMANPRAVPDEFVRDEELADQARALNTLDDGTCFDPETGEVIEVDGGSAIPEVPHALLEVPGLVGEIASWICSTSDTPQPTLAMGAALALVGTLMGRKWIGPTASSTVLYVLALAPSGAGKERQLQAIRRILREAGLVNSIGASNLTSSYAVENLVVKKPLTVSTLDEVGAFLKRILNPKASTLERDIARVFRELWGINDGDWTSTQRAQVDGSMVRAPHFSIYATGVPEELFDAVGSGEIANGTLNRFLLLPTAAQPEPLPPAVTDRAPPAGMIRTIQAICDDRLGSMNRWETPDLYCRLTRIDFVHATVRRAFYEFKREVSLGLKGGGDFRARTVEIAIRLATIRAFGRNHASPMVDMEDLQWGKDLALWSAQAMERMCSNHMAENDTQRMANKVKDAIRTLGGRCDRTSLYRQLKNTIRARDLDDTLRLLKEGGFLMEEKAIAGPKGGRPITTYLLVK